MSNQLVAPKLEQILHLNMKVETKTGLLISAGRTMGRIGGVDVESISMEREYVCKDTKITVRVPYIPGSSLKGRMRSLLELSGGLPLYSTDKKIWAHTPSVEVYDINNTKLGLEKFLEVINKYKLDKLFGYSSFSIGDLIKEQETAKRNETEQRPSPTTTNQQRQAESTDYMNIIKGLTPTLLLVDDFFVESSYVCNILLQNGIVSFNDFVEDKSENRIDRITSMADPRTILRVKPGVRFDGKISLLIYENIKKDLKEYLELMLNGLSLVENTYLGASGSRGYGRVRFIDIQLSSTKIEQGVVKDKKIEIQQEGKKKDKFEDLNDLKNNLEKIVQLF